MDQRLSFITLGVKNLQAMKEFYVDKFGWKTHHDDNGIVFFKLNGFILSLFPVGELAEDANVSAEGYGFKGFTLAICLNSEREVNDLFSDLESKGVKVVKPPHKVFWGGYSGYVADLEDNLWEIAWNPFLELSPEGNVIK